MSTMVLIRTDELPRPKKTLRIPELVARAASLTAEAHFYYVLGERAKARELLEERDTTVRPVLIGLRCMLLSPPSQEG